MTIPMLFTVPANPEVMVFTVAGPPRPESIPMTRAVARSAMNALAFTFRHRKSSTAIPMTNTSSIGMMYFPLSFYLPVFSLANLARMSGLMPPASRIFMAWGPSFSQG